MSTTDNLQVLNYEMASLEAIERHLITGGETLLSTDQEAMYERWKYADEKLRERKLKRFEIVTSIEHKFEVSRRTAMRDIVNTERLFSSTFPLNKKYGIGVLIEDFTRHVKAAAEEQDWKAVGAVGKVLATLWAIYPEATPPQSARQLIFQVIQNHITNSVTNIETAMEIIDTELAKPEDDEQ